MLERVKNSIFTPEWAVCERCVCPKRSSRPVIVLLFRGVMCRRAISLLAHFLDGVNSLF